MNHNRAHSKHRPTPAITPAVANAPTMQPTSMYRYPATTHERHRVMHMRYTGAGAQQVARSINEQAMTHGMEHSSSAGAAGIRTQSGGSLSARFVVMAVGLVCAVVALAYQHFSHARAIAASTQGDSLQAQDYKAERMPLVDTNDNAIPESDPGTPPEKDPQSRLEANPFRETSQQYGGEKAPGAADYRV